jgi:hypothetical protein
MKLSRVSRILVFAVGVLPFVPMAFAIDPTWARKAVAFPGQCDIDSSAASAVASPRGALEALPGATACKPIRIPSPDGRLVIEVKYQKIEIEKRYDLLQACFVLHSQDGNSREGTFPYGFQDIDLLWSPDSKAFFVNGGNGGAIWGFWVYVYRVDDPALEPLDITRQAQKDMVKTFPPCKASQIDLKECQAIEKDPGYNISGIDWSSGSSTLVVMAEVPCGGGYGGIKCQLMGYELDVPSGRIVGRMSAREFATGWRKSMAWRFQDPGLPEYCDGKNRRMVPGCIGHDW